MIPANTRYGLGAAMSQGNGRRVLSSIPMSLEFFAWVSIAIGVCNIWQLLSACFPRRLPGPR